MAWHKKRVQVSTQVGWGGGPHCTDNDHGTNTNYEDMLSVCKCPRWSPNTIKCSQATQRKSMGDGDRSEKREEWELTGTAIGRHQLGTIKDIGALFGPGSTAVPVLPSQGAIISPVFAMLLPPTNVIPPGLRIQPWSLLKPRLQSSSRFDPSFAFPTSVRVSIDRALPLSASPNEFTLGCNHVRRIFLIARRRKEGSRGGI